MGTTSTSSGWNRSTSTPKPAPKKPSAMRGIVAGIVVVALAAAVVLFMLKDKGSVTVKKAEKKPTKIKTVTPAKAPTNAVVKKAEKPKKLHYWERSTTNGLSPRQIMKWKHVRLPPPAYTNDFVLHQPRAEYEIFDTYAENEIAMLLTIEPGTGLVGEPNYDKSFEEEFMESCTHPIVVKDTDSEYVKQLKKDMIQTKIELRQRMADGEKLGDILADARNEALRMGLYKQEIEEQMRELINSSAQSDADIDDCVAAANKMLEQKGIAPIKVNPIVKRGIKRRLGIK